MSEYLFTAKSVSTGHPDKVVDPTSEVIPTRQAIPSTLKVLNKNLRTITVIGDTVCFAAMLAISTLLCTQCGIWKPSDLMYHAILFVLSAFILYVFNLYELKEYSFLKLICSAGLSAILFASASVWFIPNLIREQPIVFLLGSAFFTWLFLSRYFISKTRKIQLKRTSWLIIGKNEYLKHFFKDCNKNDYIPNFKCLIQPADVPPSLQAGFDMIGTWPDLKTALSQPWAGIIVATGSEIPGDIALALMSARLKGFETMNLTDYYETYWKKIPAFHIQHDWFALAQGFSLLHCPLRRTLKNAFDRIVSILLLVLFSPLMLVVSILIKLESEGPIIYKQIRTGLHGREFTIYKFRSMRMDAEKSGPQWASVKDPRVTKIGAFLRATRIDELPQLFNVIKGDMSLIGPRPERPVFNQQLEKAIPFYNFRHLIKPGVTGFAQVMYPYGASVEDATEKFQYDLYYIKNQSFLLDLKIILKTISIVLLGKGR